jgi:DNA mismatch endonuclease (patch repair protein)
MRSNGPKDTTPELVLRSHLQRSGLRFRKNVRPVKGLACEVDIAFPAAKLAVLVDGCFWHSCPQHATRPKTNATWWANKLDRNRERDASNTFELQAAGWEVVRIWEHTPVDEAAASVVTRLEAARARQVRDRRVERPIGL